MIRFIDITEEGQKKNLPFLFSYRAIRDLNKAGITAGFETIEKAAYLGFYYGHLKQNKQVPSFTEETIAEWFEEDFALITQITEIVQEASVQITDAAEGKTKTLKKV